MLTDLSLLIKLQKVDNELKFIESEKGELPELILSIENEIETLGTSIEEIIKEIADTKEEIMTLEISIDDARERIKKSQTTIYSVSTTREYDALSSEIEHSKHLIADSEKIILERNNNQRILSEQLGEMKAKLETLKKERIDKQAEMAERMDSSAEEEEALKASRLKIATELKKPVFAHYERICKIRDGVGVSALSTGACSYCFSRVPPQRQVEIRRMDDIITCETCGCIIVGEDHAEGLV